MSEFEVSSQLQRHDLHKLHGLGNDFLVWFRPSVPDNAASLARAWCHRTSGLGADGLIIAIDDRSSPQFVLFNADGGQPEISGNGLRCFGHAIAARRGLDELIIEAMTPVGLRTVEVSQALSMNATVAVGMGAPKPGPSLEGIDLGASIAYLRASSVDVGNPHIVITVESIDSVDIATVGAQVEAHFLPTGANVHVIEITPAGVQMRIWERGVGVTEACGSGACAAAAVVAKAQPGKTQVVVEMPGGTARVEVDDELTLHGPSTYIAAIASAVAPLEL